MTLTMAMLLFGALLVYAGWTNRSVGTLLRGDNSAAQAKPQAALK